MGARYAHVYEAFHAFSEAHAHAESVDEANKGTGLTFQEENVEETSTSLAASDKMKLFNNDGEEIGVYDDTWQKTSLPDITTFSELKYLMTNHNGFHFKLEDVLSKSLDGTTYDDFFGRSVDDYLRATHSYKDGAEIQATNSYLLSLQRDENERLLKLNDKYRNNVLTTKQMYMMVNRDSHNIRSNIRIILYAILLAAVLMALMPSHQTTWAKILMALAIVFFFLYAVLHVRRNRSRRFTDFSKFFFQKGDLPDGKDKDASSNVGDEAADGSTGAECQA